MDPVGLSRRSLRYKDRRVAPDDRLWGKKDGLSMLYAEMPIRTERANSQQHPPVGSTLLLLNHPDLSFPFWTFLLFLDSFAFCFSSLLALFDCFVKIISERETDSLSLQLQLDLSRRRSHVPNSLPLLHGLDKARSHPCVYCATKTFQEAYHLLNQFSLPNDPSMPRQPAVYLYKRSSQYGKIEFPVLHERRSQPKNQRLFQTRCVADVH
ncbi:hypothetical protein MAPG_06484 [Magnaporthiopsis poae ATCC 64411]|uniref:Uncharacterized protein n=1 Tax=Magnaporthiopsis poae (strain ATCC 64411 / 73-15) TaxID=644358 RepID=A0A0C4E255_MAGP6|nr:hypothetical protein MAPG_06484 [Magnaporthiopsis poae ATCC 64411]